MPQEIEVQRPRIVDLFLAALLAVLVETILGSLIGLVAWPALEFVWRRANPALSVVTVAVDCSAALLSFWVFGLLSALSSSPSGTHSLVYRNRRLFPTARFASILIAIIFLFQLIAFELQGVVLRYVGSSTELNTRSAAWVLLVGVGVPTLLFFAVLILGARRQEPAEWRASNSA